jgi:hypothetical protein
MIADATARPQCTLLRLLVIVVGQLCQPRALDQKAAGGSLMAVVGSRTAPRDLRVNVASCRG